MRFFGYARCQMIKINPMLNQKRIYFLEIQQGLFHFIVIRAWGRIGQKVRCKEEWYEDMEIAIKQANRIYIQKAKKGYIESNCDWAAAI